MPNQKAAGLFACDRCERVAPSLHARLACGPVFRAAGSVLAFCLTVTPAMAQDVPDGNGVKVGETRLYPEVRLDYLAFDNVFLSDADETAASAVQLSPRARWRAERRLVELEARYDGHYSAGNEDVLDFAEHRLGLTADVSPTSRIRLDGRLEYARLTDVRRLRSVTDDEPPIERLDIDRFDLSVAATYGAVGARGNVRIGLDVDGFDPNIGSDGGRFFFSRDKFTRIEPFAQFSLRISPDTRWLLEARLADVDNRLGDDNSRVSVLTGLTFATSGAFGGEFRVGVTRISFDDRADRQEASTARVGAGLFYAPTSFSRFRLEFGRDFDPGLVAADSAADSSISTTGGLTWRYAYSERFYHVASLSVRDNEVSCPSAGRRDIDAGFEFNVRVRRWIELGAGVGHQIDRIEDCATTDDSTDPDLIESDATRLGVHVRAIL